MYEYTQNRVPNNVKYPESGCVKKGKGSFTATLQPSLNFSPHYNQRREQHIVCDPS